MNDQSESFDFVTSSLIPMQTKNRSDLQGDLSKTKSSLEVDEGQIESPEIFSQNFF